MSRAFVRESDFPQLPELPPQASPIPSGTKNYLTAAGAGRLRAELEELRCDRSKLAGAPADDSDAKRDQQLMDQRIRYLQESLRTGEIVPIVPGPAQSVRFGTTVTVRESTGATMRYRIVGVDEADADRGWVSWLSPIARALANANRGDRVVFKAPRGPRELEVVAIEYEG